MLGKIPFRPSLRILAKDPTGTYSNITSRVTSAASSVFSTPALSSRSSSTGAPTPERPGTPTEFESLDPKGSALFHSKIEELFRMSLEELKKFDSRNINGLSLSEKGGLEAFCGNLIHQLEEVDRRVAERERPEPEKNLLTRVKKRSSPSNKKARRLSSRFFLSLKNL